MKQLSSWWLVLAAELAGAPLVAQGTLPSGVLVPPSGYGSTNSYFGRAASLYTDWALVGAVGQGGTHGAAYLFEESGGRWVPREDLDPPSGLTPADGFGSAVALGSGLAAVGAPGSSGRAGLVALYRATGGAWELFQTLRAASPAAGDGFGTSLGLAGDVLLIGAPGLRAVEVHRSSGGAWSLAERLSAPAGTPDESFGEALAFDGSVAAVGAPEERRAFVFDGAAGAFVLRAELEPWLAQRGKSFGAALAVCDGDVLVGAPEDDDGRGSAYLFERQGSQWSSAWAFTDPWSVAETYFAKSVGMTPGAVVIGAPGDEDLVLGAVYVYRRRQGDWIRETAIVPTFGASGQFGSYVAAYGDSLLSSIGLDDILPFGFYGGAILIWELAGAGPLRALGTSGSAAAPLAR